MDVLQSMKANIVSKPKRVIPAKPVGKAPAKKVEPGSSYNAIMEIIAWADTIPEETWEDIPNDLSKQFKHYMYGSPRVPE